MITYIEILNKPRQVGKTTKLLDMLNKHIAFNNQVLYLCCSETEVKRVKRLNSENMIKKEMLYFTYTTYHNLKSKFEYKMRGIFSIQEPIFILLDEPFIVDRKLQQDILEFLEYLPYSFYIYGEGTKLQNFRKDFTHYIKEEN